MKLRAHRSITPPAKARTFFCGDVHGQLTQLKKQLDAVNFALGSDQLILTGDLIDRGKESKEVVEFVANTRGVYSVLGNHEMMFLHALDDEFTRSVYLSSRFGGAWIEEYSDKALKKIADLIRRHLSFAITVQHSYPHFHSHSHSHYQYQYQIGVIHAAAPRNWAMVQSLNISNSESFLWSRDQYTQAKSNNKPSPIKGIDAVVHGHVWDEITVAGNQVWIDTYGKTDQLTLIQAEEVIGLTQPTRYLGNNIHSRT